MSYKEKREMELKKEAEEKAAKAAAEVSFIRRNLYFLSGLISQLIPELIWAKGSNRYNIILVGQVSGLSPKHL